MGFFRLVTIDSNKRYVTFDLEVENFQQAFLFGFGITEINQTFRADNGVVMTFAFKKTSEPATVARENRHHEYETQKDLELSLTIAIPNREKEIVISFEREELPSLIVHDDNRLEESSTYKGVGKGIKVGSTQYETLRYTFDAVNRYIISLSNGNRGGDLDEVCGGILEELAEDEAGDEVRDEVRKASLDQVVDTLNELIEEKGQEAFALVSEGTRIMSELASTQELIKTLKERRDIIKAKSEETRSELAGEGDMGL